LSLKIHGNFRLFPGNGAKRMNSAWAGRYTQSKGRYGSLYRQIEFVAMA